MKRGVILLLTGICLIAVFFWKQIFTGEVLYCCDNLLINIPSKVYFVEEVKASRFPIWNPYIFSGAPFFADINNALLYPLNILYAILPPFRALTWVIVVNFLLAFVGMYLFARRLLMSRFSGFVSAVVFAFSGTMVVYTNNAPMIQVAALLPWVIWSTDRFLAFPSGKTLSVAVAIAVLQIFAGHPQLTFYTWLLTISFAVWFYKKRAMLLLLLIFLATLLSAVQTLPFLEFVLESTRPLGDYGYATFDSLNPFAIARLIVPPLAGNLSLGYAYFFGGSVYGYVGIAALFLAVISGWKRKTVSFFATSCILAFLLALGKNTPVFWVAYHLIPGLGSFRSPQHFLLIHTFSAAILAGFGIERLRSFRICILGVILIELFVFSRNNLLTAPYAKVEQWMMTSGKLEAHFGSINKEDSRIFVDPNVFPYPDARGWPFIDMPGETAWAATILRPNLNMLYRIGSIDGYASMVLRNYQQSVAPQTKDPTGVDLKSVSPETLNTLGVRYTIAKGTDGKPEGKELSGWKPQKVMSSPVPMSIWLGLIISIIGLLATAGIGFMWKEEKLPSKVRLKRKGLPEKK